MLSGPAHANAFAKLQQKVQLLDEERVVVFEGESEERIRLNEGTAAGDDLRTSVGDKVERCELLKDPHGICRAQDSNGARKPDALRASGRCGEDDRRRGVEIFGSVVLADPEGVEPDFIGKLDLLEQIAEPVRRADRGPGDRVLDRRREAVDADLHYLNSRCPNHFRMVDYHRL